MAGITLGRRATASYFRAPRVYVHPDDTVRCEVSVKNTGAKTITANLSKLFAFYAHHLVQIYGRECKEAWEAWSYYGYEGKYWETNATDIQTGGTYDYTIDINGSLGLSNTKDVGLIYTLDTDGDGEPDIFLDCLLVEEAFQVFSYY